MSRRQFPFFKESKYLLSFCYRNGLIGPYRRIHAAWIISFNDRQLIYDDRETIDFLKRELVKRCDLMEKFVQDQGVQRVTPAPGANRTHVPGR